jgi:hypothetical protein
MIPFLLIIYGQKETKAYYSAKGREEATAPRIFDRFYPRQTEANPAATYQMLMSLSCETRILFGCTRMRCGNIWK